MNIIKSLAAAFMVSAGMLLTVTASAENSAADIARLGQDLTPFGSEKAGNSDGSIPAWDGGLSKPPAGWDKSKGYVNPYAGEKPLYTITGQNVAQYDKLLAPGQIALLKRFSTYKLNVYPSHRSVAFPDAVYGNIKAEAPSVKLIAGGNGITGINKSPVPFLVPQSGIEVIWDHITRFRGGTFKRYSTSIPVQSNGLFTVVKFLECATFAPSMEKPIPNRLINFLQVSLAPSNVSGEGLLVWETIDQVKEPRQAWTYNPGQRRVLQAPEVAYDGPLSNGDGLGTVDDYDMYNGSPDRYDWKLLGKKEMIISYNNYELNARSHSYKDIVGPEHLNQDLIRYELHRVWVVEATLKAGMRHIYAKRVFFVDEDSRAIVHADEYDGHGELWRVKDSNAMEYYDVPTPFTAGDVSYDLQARRYIVQNLSNEEKPIDFGKTFGDDFYTPNNLRRVAD